MIGQTHRASAGSCQPPRLLTLAVFSQGEHGQPPPAKLEPVIVFAVVDVTRPDHIPSPSTGRGFASLR